MYNIRYLLSTAVATTDRSEYYNLPPLPLLRSCRFPPDLLRCSLIWCAAEVMYVSALTILKPTTPTTKV